MTYMTDVKGSLQDLHRKAAKSQNEMNETNDAIKLLHSQCIQAVADLDARQAALDASNNLQNLGALNQKFDGILTQVNNGLQTVESKAHGAAGDASRCGEQKTMIPLQELMQTIVDNVAAKWRGWREGNTEG